MTKYKVKISYDGTRYSGWQIQPSGLSIQQVLQETLSRILQESISVTGSGRTDAGVHAIGQIAHFSADVDNQRRLLRSLNGLLPPDIRIHSIEEVSEDFHARYSARGKIYHYHLWLEETHHPLKRHHHLHHPYPLDIDRLKHGAAHLVGTHDFTSFANSPTEGSVAKNPVRTIYRIDCIPQEGGMRLEFEGEGFLYKMVRNIVGTLLDRDRVDQIPKILAARDRRNAGRAAPPHGLFLVEVHYD